MLIRALLALSLGAALLLTLACDGGGGGVYGKPTANDPECTNQATRTAAWEVLTPGVPTREPSTPMIPDDERRCRLRRALVALGDLPSGAEYSSFLDHSIPYPPAPVACQVAAPYVVGGVESSWDLPSDSDDPDGRALVRQKIFVTGEGDGERIFAALRRACNFTRVEDDGDIEQTLTFEERSLGDDLPAIVAVETIPDINGFIFSTSVVAAVGDIIIRSNVTESRLELPPEHKELAVRLTELALSRMPKVGALPEAEPYEGGDCVEAERVANDPDLSRALLRLEDMSRAAVEQPFSCRSIDATLDCEGTRPTIADSWDKSAAVTFSDGESFRGGYVVQQVVEYDTEGDASRAIETVLSGATGEAACDSASTPGRRIGYGRVGAVAVGERAGAWVVTLSDSPFPPEMTLVIFQRGSVISILLTTSRKAVEINTAADRRIMDYLR